MANNKTIGVRLLRTVFGCYLSVAIAVTSVQLAMEYLNIKKNVFFELSHLSDTLEDSLARALWNYNSEQVQATLGGINKVIWVSGTRITNVDKEIIGASGIGRDSKGQTSILNKEGVYGRGTIQKISYSHGHDYNTAYEYTFPVHYVDDKESPGALVGYFHIYADRMAVLDRVKDGFIVILVNSFIKTLALWFIFLYFFKRIIASPLNFVTQAARALDPNDPNTFRETGELERISNSGDDDEMKVLVDSFIKMRDAVVDKIHIIEKQKLTLEHRVADRTSSLTRTNKDLQKEIEQRIKAEEDLRIYLEIILNTDEAIIVTTRDGTIREANPAYERHSGYSREELIGSKSELLDSSNHDADIYREMWASISSNGHWQGEICGTTNDGRPVPLWIVVSTMYDEKGEIEHLIALYRNISELKQTQARLAQAQKLESIGQLATGIAHEINTPTQFVGDNIHFLGDAFKDLVRLQDAYSGLLEAARKHSMMSNEVERIENAMQEADSEFLVKEVPMAIEQATEGVRRIAGIVGAMKSLSHMGSGDVEPADLNEAIKNTITVARNEWKYVAELEVDFEEDLPTVPCYLAEFNQVMLNLIVNAAHAIADVIDGSAGEKGTIRVSTRQVDQHVEIRVSDTGKGIPEEVRDRIFDPFFTTKEVGKGTGQGLAIAHATIVDKHNGSLDLETEVGKGATFVITIPLREAGADPTEVAA